MAGPIVACVALPGADRRVRPVGRVAEVQRDLLERQPQLLGGDLGQTGARAGADVLRAGHDVGRAVALSLTQA